MPALGGTESFARAGTVATSGRPVVMLENEGDGSCGIVNDYGVPLAVSQFEWIGNGSRTAKGIVMGPLRNGIEFVGNDVTPR